MNDCRMRSEEELKTVTEKMVETLMHMADGTQTSVCGLLEASGLDVNSFDIGDLMDLGHEVTLAAGRRNILLDWTESLRRLDSLPFVLEFRVTRVGAA